MDIYEAIEKRRTIRKFKGPASDEQIKKIISTGTKAPSARNGQSWEFIIVDDPELIEKISERKYLLIREDKPRGVEVPSEQEKAAQAQKDSFANASLVMVFHSKGATHAAGAWCCIQNMLLAAVAEGLGTKITYYAGKAAQDINKLLQVPEGMELAAAISIGVPAEEPGPKELRAEGSWLHQNQF